MDDRQKLIWGGIALGGAVLIIAAYIVTPTRFALIGAGNGVAYRIDRNTGDIWTCVYGECRPAVIRSETSEQEATASAGGSDGDSNTSWEEEYLAREAERNAQANSN